MNFKNAWRCKKCPESSNENGCPCWIEMVYENSQTGQIKQEKKCLFLLLPEFLISITKSSDVNTENVSKMQNGIKPLVDFISLKMVETIEHKPNDVKQIKEGDEVKNGS